MYDSANTAGFSTDPNFRGAEARAYRINADGTLTYADASFSAAQTYPDSTKVVWVSTAQPRYVNAPAGIFENQSKYGAYLRIQVAQSASLKPLTNVLSWTAYPAVNPGQQQDMQSGPLDWDDTANAFGNIMLPNGSGGINLGWFATVGPAAKTIWTIFDSTFKSLSAVAAGNAGTMLAVPASDLVIADLIENTISTIVGKFAPKTSQQIWIKNSNLIEFAFQDPAAKTSGTGEAMRLPKDVEQQIILVPTTSNPGDYAQLSTAKARANQGQSPDQNYPTWVFEGQGQMKLVSYQDFLAPYLEGGNNALKFTVDAVPITPAAAGVGNPFDYIPYVIVTLKATSSTTSNPT